MNAHEIKIGIGSIGAVIAIDAQIPEFTIKTPAAEIIKRINDREHLLLIAKHKNKPVAYKLGYALSESEFYSWHGAVVPDYRKMGIATQLRQAQEEWAKERGYRSISVKSMNKFPAMLQLLISSGYQIAGYINEGHPQRSKILFCKSLKDS